MIALREYGRKFKNEYFNTIFPMIEGRFKISDYNEVVKAFPEMTLENNELNKVFFRQLLTEKLPGKSEHVNNVFNRAMITSCDMDFLYAKERSQKKRSEIRKEVYDTYPIQWNKEMREYEPWKTEKEWNELRSRIKKADDELNKQLKSLFQYSDIDRSLRARIFLEQGITVCPYCNRQYIGVISSNNEKYGQATGDIDHFFSQSNFPLFAESLYNFVPSCKVCNSLFKHTKNSMIFYPYEESIMNAFSFEPYSDANKITLNDLFGWKGLFEQREVVSIRIKINDSISEQDQKKAQREKRLFKYNETYQLHNEYVRNLIYKRNILDKTVISEIIELINNKGMQNTSYYISEKEIRWMLYNMDCDNPDFRVIPLSKLTFDILRYFT